MWLWILSAIFLILLWGAWFWVPLYEILPLWIPVIATAAIVLLLAGIIAYRKIRAARAARALEKAIAQQAQEQALNAKPERVAEIQELYRQVQAGIQALKTSKLGGGRTGSDALYVLPWYAIVGPPGAGKTTALKHSGLVFPFLDKTGGGGVRGVGGTRNCDWWFTNEAILLDTAGRYTTEADDHEEWMAFLEMLLKFRSHKPLNGVIVAVSITDLVDGTDEQIQQMGRKVRARVDEMQSTLHMVLPVYVLFTKCDLIAGFSEFFGGLKKSERAQAWGATVRMDADKSDPGKLFDAEFDTLVERVHDHGLRRLVTERSQGTKEKVYQFPLEFAAIKHNLSDFISAFLAPSAGEKVEASAHSGGGYPIFRGFYFTSGTQEGRPLDRVIGNIQRAMGLKAVSSDEADAKALEPKSYFLRDVFMNVIFPDQDIAARTEAELRRRLLQRYVIAAAALALALLLFIPACISFGNNQALVGDTRTVSKEAKDVAWDNPPEAWEKIGTLKNLADHSKRLKDWNKDTPVDHGWFMYQGDKLFQPTTNQYIFSLKKAFVNRAREDLKNKLLDPQGAKYLDQYNHLRTYLLLNDKDHLQDNVEWQTARLTQLWADFLRSDPAVKNVPETELKATLSPHVRYYVELLRDGDVPGEQLEQPVIERAQNRLRNLDPYERYYDQFVTVLVDEKIDENGPRERSNLKYPPVTLKDLFSDRPDVLDNVMTSKLGKQVDGPYTAKGHAQVLASLQDGYKLLQREQWVLPLSEDEKTQGEKIQKELQRVRRSYQDQYILQWEAFFNDIHVIEPEHNKQALDEYRSLATADWPYQRLLRELHDATQFPQDEGAGAAMTGDAGIMSQVEDKLKRKLDSRVMPGASTLLPGQATQGPPPNPITQHFKSMVRFGVPPPAKEGQPPPPAPGLDKYVGLIDGLAGEMQVIEDGPPASDTKPVREKFEEAVRTSESLLLTMDDTGHRLMRPLLMRPLKLGYKAVVKSAGGGASGLWNVMVWPEYRDKIKGRYPFDLAATRDASFEDAVAFFKPRDGVLWGFYEQYLKPFHYKQGHQYIPNPHLSDGPGGKRFTPFKQNLYNCLEKSDKITDALWGGGAGDKPHVAFQLNLKTVSPIVSDVIFEVDGQVRHYRNEKPFWHEFVWPGEKPTGARIQVRGAGGLDEEVIREGRWGVFRLFEAATTTAKEDSDDAFAVTWQFTAPPVTVVMEVRPTRGNHPFPSSFFRATNCPPDIGDAFGKAAGN